MHAGGMLGAAGGLGLFLLGMRLMTEALQAMAGGGMQRWLGRVTRNPWAGALTGMAVTAVVRSSGATTVAAVGFVSAGILGFEQALGVILGANVGTTLTGWIVALFGFKFDLGRVSLGLVFVGALLTLLGKGRWPRIGTALAGFALLFIGLDLLKAGLAELADGFSAHQLDARSAGGRLLWLGFGVAFSLLTQSSGATVATALAAMDSGMIDLSQALAVVIGADVGTTATAWLASLGGTTDSRRTGLSHVVYNLLTGTAAFLLLPVYQSAIRHLMPEGPGNAAPFVTVAFHSGFNIVGALVVLPFTGRFAAWMRRLVPERSPLPSAVLDRRLLATPAAAIETLRHAVAGTADMILVCLEKALGRPPVASASEHLGLIARSARECRGFVGTMSGTTVETRVRERLPDLLHALDHIDRLVDRCRDAETIGHLAGLAALDDQVKQLRIACAALRSRLRDPVVAHDPDAELAALAQALEDGRPGVRRHLIESAVRGDIAADALDRALDAHRWLRRAAWHAQRISHHLSATSAAV